MLTEQHKQCLTVRGDRGAAMKKGVLILVSAAILLAGCSVNKTLTPTGGSKADGTVDLSYEFGAFEKPVIDYTSAQVNAEQRCKAWGYTNAESFGGEKRQCQAFDGYGNCARFFVTVTYQCTGGKV
jgi:YecR-like lipoprotein